MLRHHQPVIDSNPEVQCRRMPFMTLTITAPDDSLIETMAQFNGPLLLNGLIPGEKK
jgi:hypothetical protein